MIFEKLESIFEIFINYSILAIEFIGVCVLLWAVAKGVFSFLRHRKGLRLELAEGIALALEFKMGSELLRTVIVREVGELLILGAVILLRAALSFLIHWEIGNEKRNSEKQPTKE